MSMSQSGPPDPQTPGPVSGSPQSPPAPPPQPSQQPPPSFTTPGARPPTRPAPLVMGAIAVGVIGLLLLISAIVSLLGLEFWLNDFTSTGTSTSLYVNGAYSILLALVAFAAAGLALSGADLGRALAAGVAGAAIWEAAGWWQFIIAMLIDGDFAIAHFAWIRGISAILGGFLGIAAIIMLGMPTISSYIAAKRGPAARPQAGFAPMGPAPSGPPPSGPARPGPQHPNQPPPA
ncbi:MAG: hypothetical protein ACRD0P_36125 [Stackebrandtia sp.]